MNQKLSIDELQQEIVESFSVFEDWMDKYAYLIELGNNLPDFDNTYRTEKYIIKGCQSRVWLYTSMENGLMKFVADSDALIVKGIIALLHQIYSGRSPKEILNTKTDFISKIGLDKHLSPTRSNGLLAMIKQIKFYALAYSQSTTE